MGRTRPTAAQTGICVGISPLDARNTALHYSRCEKLISYTFGAIRLDREETFVEFEWNRSRTIALAKESCSQCQGAGLREANRKGPEAPCG